ncbi:hypothetical protein ACFL0J_04195 [Candidatus Neomarinimicrobiota bacterium]
MKNITLFIICILFIFSGKTKAQDSLWTRNYQFGIYNEYDLRNSSTNAISTHRILNDVFRKELKPKMNEKLGNISYGIFNFASTYLTMLWSHEFGHSLRAKQVGGEFRIHDVALPIPYTTMHLPSDVSLVDEALSVTAGFEVNYLTIRKIHEEFITNNGTYNEDLGFSFANRLMYPIYTSLIVPINPEDRDVWIDTAGDPIHYILPVFKNYSDNNVFMQDGSVNPDLVNFYNQSAIFASFIHFLDPQFYRELGANFGDGDKTRRPIFLIGNYKNGWTYSTLFNVSPLGYELYLNNYLHLKGTKFSIYTKYGNPYKNNGIGMKWINIIDNSKLKFSSWVDLWDQDIFGKGVSGEIEAKMGILENIDININFGYKTEGYVLGKQINKGINLGIGIIYSAKYY